MVTNEERREAAERLRLTVDPELGSAYLGEVAMALGLEDEYLPLPYYAVDSGKVRHLADLIDPPTCRMTTTERKPGLAQYECSECGERCVSHGTPRFCQSCGARNEGAL